MIAVVTLAEATAGGVLLGAALSAAATWLLGPAVARRQRREERREEALERIETLARVDLDIACQQLMMNAKSISLISEDDRGSPLATDLEEGGVLKLFLTAAVGDLKEADENAPNLLNSFDLLLARTGDRYLEEAYWRLKMAIFSFRAIYLAARTDVETVKRARTAIERDELRVKAALKALQERSAAALGHGEEGAKAPKSASRIRRLSRQVLRRRASGSEAPSDTPPSSSETYPT